MTDTADMISVLATTAVFGIAAGAALRHGADSRRTVVDPHRGPQRPNW